MKLMKLLSFADGKNLKITKPDIIVISLLILIPLFFITSTPDGTKKNSSLSVTVKRKKSSLKTR